MGDHMQATKEKKEKEDPIMSELKQSISGVSYGRILYSELNFNTEKEAKNIAERAKKLFPWNFESKLVRLEVEKNKIYILPGENLKFSANLFLEDAPIFEGGALLPEKIRDELKNIWSKMVEKYPDIGFHLLFSEKGEIKIAYLKLNDESKRELEDVLSNYKLGLKEVVPGYGIYGLTRLEERGGIMESKVKEKVHVQTSEDKTSQRLDKTILDRIRKLQESHPDEEILNDLSKILNETYNSEKKIINDWLPQVVGVLIGIENYKQDKIEGYKAKEISLFEDPELNKNIIEIAKKRNLIIKFEENPTSLNVEKAYEVAGKLAGAYIGREKILAEFNKLISRGILDKLEEYYDLKDKYSQLLKENKNLKMDIAKLEKTKQPIANDLKNQLAQQEKTITKVEKDLEKREEDIKQYKEKFEKIVNLVFSATDLNTLKADLEKITGSTATVSASPAVATKSLSNLNDLEKEIISRADPTTKDLPNNFSLPNDNFDKNFLNTLPNQINVKYNNINTKYKIIKRQKFVIFTKE